ncbi:MAG: diacylglycerol kinase family protein [Bacteroidota bacterium]
MKLTTRFIVNPFSGGRKKNNIGHQLKKYLDHDKFDYELCVTREAGHATELAAQAVQEGMDLVVAIGGDGSVNEVAAALVDTPTGLGILPAGSGNGLAMHLGMGRDLVKAIRRLNQASVRTIDSCCMNGRPFVNLAGVGFDGQVAYKLKKSTHRGFQAYLRYTLWEALQYKGREYRIVVDGQPLPIQSLMMLEVANAPMFGYNFEIAPLAKLDDGLFEVLLFKEAPTWRYLLDSWRFIDRSIHKSPLVERLVGRKIRMETDGAFYVHVDGEGMLLEESLEFDIKPLSLKVFAPQPSMA